MRRGREDERWRRGEEQGKRGGRGRRGVGEEERRGGEEDRNKRGGEEETKRGGVGKEGTQGRGLTDSGRRKGRRRRGGG